MNPHLSFRRWAAPLAAVLVSAVLAGCGPATHVDSASTVAPPAAVVAGWAGRADVGRAIDCLNDGKVADARAILRQVLVETPGDRMAADLLGQVDGDPQALLGRASFAYTVRSGDTLSTLAGRFLGNPTRFYALGRYNGLEFPAVLRPGMALRIPGTAKAVAGPHAPPPRTAGLVAKPAAPALPVVPPAPAPRLDPGRAAGLRAAALEQLNRGAIDRAILLLRQAGQLSPGNPLVQRDLDRALRIQQAVHRRG